MKIQMNKTAVLIPHFNNPLGLVHSLASINEELPIDVVIVDDGSQDRLICESEITKNFRAEGKIVFLYLNINRGIEYALNFGLDYIIKNNYKFTARLDAGDLCEKNRFYKQSTFLESNLAVKLLGTNVKAQNEAGKFLYNLKFPEKHKDIKNRMYVNAMFIHPTVMFVNDIFSEIKKYPLDYQAAEDYALFFEIVKRYETANLPETLVTIEINETGITKTKRTIQVSNRIRIIKKHFHFGFWPIYGLIRNYLLLLIPNQIIEKIKILIK